MKMFLFILVMVVHCVVWAAYNPYVHCADVDLTLRVVDGNGSPVQGVEIAIAYQIADEEAKVARGSSDHAGRLVSSGRSNSIVNIWAKKAGYYETTVRENVAVSPKEEVVRTHRWSSRPVEIELVLKSIRKPVALLRKAVDYKPYPATNEVVKLDLEMLDWCPPYGRGRHDDLHLVFDGWRNPKEWLDFHEHLTVSMPNCVDGFYRQKIDGQSKLRYAYEADTNAVYEKSFCFRHVMTPGGNTESRRLAEDEYLIYRIRTQTNELGQVTHAHYGRIGEKFSQYIGLSIKSWFNPTDNDTNLEADELSKPRRRSMRR